MSFALSPRTSQGATVVAAAGSLVESLAQRAQAADTANAVSRENFDDLVRSGVASAFVPEELGGFGLESIHDWILTITTLARGDASVAIAVNMQLAVSRGLVQSYSDAKARLGTDHRTTIGLGQLLGKLVTGEVVICATATEPGTDNLHPLTEAVRDGDSADSGWRINGRKIFVTLSPIATHLAMNLRLRDADGDHLATVMLPMDTPGLLPQNDWDALGMRSSGSQSVLFDDVRVAFGDVHKLGVWGSWSLGMLQNRATSNLPLVGAFLGVAEAAHDIALAHVASHARLGQPVSASSGVQHLVGEMALELAQCRATLGAAALQMDEYFARHTPSGSPATMEDAASIDA